MLNIFLQIIAYKYFELFCPTQFVCKGGECYCINENGEQLDRSVPEDRRSELSCYTTDTGCGADNQIV